MKKLLLISCALLLVLPLSGCSKKRKRRQIAQSEEVEYPYVDPRFGSAKRQEAMLRKTHKKEQKDEMKAQRFEKRRKREIRQKYGYTY